MDHPHSALMAYRLPANAVPCRLMLGARLAVEALDLDRQGACQRDGVVPDGFEFVAQRG